MQRFTHVQPQPVMVMMPQLSQEEQQQVVRTASAPSVLHQLQPHPQPPQYHHYFPYHQKTVESMRPFLSRTFSSGDNKKSRRKFKPYCTNDLIVKKKNNNNNKYHDLDRDDNNSRKICSMIADTPLSLSSIHDDNYNDDETTIQIQQQREQQQQNQSADPHPYMSLYPVLLNYNTLASVSSDEENNSSTIQQQKYSPCTVQKETTMIDQTSTLNNELKTSLLPTSSRSLHSMPSFPLLPTSSMVVTSNQGGGGGGGKKVRRSRSLVSTSWNKQFQELLQFRKVYDHCLVPRVYHENPKLSQWVQKQRHQRKRKNQGLSSTLSDERQELLSNLAGFCWDSHQAVWNEQFQSLEVFHIDHGHCTVPSNHPDSSLFNWVRYQKKQFQLYQAGSSKSSMDEERFLHLLSIGFK